MTGLSDSGVAAKGGIVCQNFDEHDEEVPMRGGPFEGRMCPECGRFTGGDLEIPYVDDLGVDETASRRGRRLSGQLIAPIIREDGDQEVSTTVRRGPVTDRSKRIVRASGDGFSTYLPAEHLDVVIASLLELRWRIDQEGLTVPDCIYCSAEHETVEEARKHAEEEHAERQKGRVRPLFDPEWYEPDPRGEIL